MAYRQRVFSESPYTTDPNIVVTEKEHIMPPDHTIT
jgi:hypothetical protein